MKLSWFGMLLAFAGLGFIGTSVMPAQVSAQEEEGYVSLFDGKTLDGWSVKGGSAKYSVEDGAIVGVCDPESKKNTFLFSDKEFGDFILKAEFKVLTPGNSGIQFRSHYRADGDGTSVYGYQAEIDPSDKNETGRIYDEGRRGFQHGRTWLDENTPETLKPAQDAYKADDWNTYEIQAIGPSLRTWINGVPVSNIFDPVDLQGHFGLQIHAGPQGSVAWRNIRVKDLGQSQWHAFFNGEGENAKLDGARFVLPDEWKFVSDGYLLGSHSATEPRDGLVVSDENYADFAVKVTYRIFGGNSGLYFRAEENDVPWLMRGFQNEIADDQGDGGYVSSGIWHTQGLKEDGTVIPGRGWLGRDEEFVAKVLNKGDWNTICTVAIGNRIVNFMNDFRTLDFTDNVFDQPSGKVGLQLHGSANIQMWFKDFDILPLTPEQVKLIQR
ncbi:MAG: DUF1080 domain-containing protein [Planctomycetia bacterium]|nr:DUF1080 domain-containing protein [Planctomycetia bacterium]